jgi:hypothetical protein
LTPTHSLARSSATQCLTLLPAVISCHLHERPMQHPCRRHAATRSCRQLPTHCRDRAGVFNLHTDSLVQPPPVRTSIRPSGMCPASDYPPDLEGQAESMTQTNRAARAFLGSHSSPAHPTQNYARIFCHLFNAPSRAGTVRVHYSIPHLLLTDFFTLLLLC